jgi:hypothetical protein
MVIVGFVGFGLSLFSVHLYVNAKSTRTPAPGKTAEPEARTELRRAA